MASGDDIRTVVKRHTPQLRYHPLEEYRADSAAAFTDFTSPRGYSNSLWSEARDGVVAKAAPVGSLRRLSLELLKAEGEEYWPEGPTVEADDHLDGHRSTLSEDSSSMHDRPGYGDVAYCHWHPREESEGPPRWLQYWLFYYHNPFTLGSHEGDWEGIRIEVDDKLDPVAAVYNRHDGEMRLDWEDVSTVDGAGITPIVYVARGSHASYFTPGAKKRLWFLRFAYDHCSDKGDHVSLTPRIIDLEKDRWIEWPGRWGGTNNRLSKSPRGPKFHDEWSAPEKIKPLPDFESPELSDDEPFVPSPIEATAWRTEGSELVVDFEIPGRPGEGQSDPVRVDLALYGVTGTPTVGSYDVLSLTPEIRHPLPSSGPPYRLHFATYDEAGSENLRPPIEIGAAPPPPRAELEDAPPRPSPMPSRGLRLDRMQPTELVRVNVQAPLAGPDAERELQRVAARVPVAGAPFQVSPMFPNSRRDSDLARWFTLAGTPVASPGDRSRVALDAANAVAESLGPAWVVEPDVPIGSFRPEAGELVAELEDDLDHHWALDRLNCKAAWDLPHPNGREKGGGIRIGQPDTGYTEHPELDGSIDLLRAYDVVRDRAGALAILRGVPPIAFPSHGTGTASVAVSRERGSIAGSAPEADLIPIRAASSVVHLFNGDLAVAVDRLRRSGAQVITISMGGIGYPASLRTALNAALSEGIVVMAAAGQPLPIVVEPARFPECIGVGAVNPDDSPWSLSARGREVDFSAPGTKVWVASTENDGTFRWAKHSGTSFAVALSAGVAALWLAHHGTRRVVDEFGPGVQYAFRSLARKTARVPDGWDEDQHGAGIIDAEALLQADLSDADPTAPEPIPPDELEWVFEAAAALAPEGVTVETIKAKLRGLFGGDDDALADNGRELLHALTEDAAARGEVLGGPLDPALSDELPTSRIAGLASAKMRAELAED